MTLIYAAKHLLLHCVPLTFCTVLYNRSLMRNANARVHRIVFHFVFAAVTLFDLWSLRLFRDSYGYMAVWTNGLKLWTGQ